jgi:pyridoxine 4-dehydrogenase
MANPRLSFLALVLFGCALSTLDALNLDSQPSRRDFFTQTASSVVAGSITSPLWIPSVARAEDAVSASPSPLKLPRMGLGCWAWGDSLFWGYNPKNDADLKEVFDFAVSNKSTEPVLFDTAELYGFGRSESLLGEYSKNTKEGDAIFATKFAPFPFRTKPENLVKACEASVQRLGGKPIDLYQIHFPNAYANAAYWDGLAMAYEKGLVKAVGVSNYGIDATRACHAALAKRGIPLATNQIQYSLVYRYPEENGLLQACKDLGVEVLSYSPMALGLLTGKYDTETVKDIVGPRKQLFQKTVGTPEFDNLLASMKQVASHHGETANLPQVAINWCRAKGTIPIPGARTLRQVQSNYGSLDWTMSPEEVKFLDQAASSSSLSYIKPEASPMPKQDKDTGLIMFDS